jgi:hypothetical protein
VEVSAGAMSIDSAFSALSSRSSTTAADRSSSAFVSCPALGGGPREPRRGRGCPLPDYERPKREGVRAQTTSGPAGRPPSPNASCTCPRA